MDAESKSAPAARPLSLITTLAFSSAAIPTAALGLTLAVYLPRYFGLIGVPLGVVGAAFGIVRLIDVFFDPVLGIAMDRTRLGRYRVWTMIGAPIIMVACYALFMAQRGIGEAYIVVWLLILYIGTSIFGLSQASWAAKLAPAYDQRSRLFAIMGAVGVLGALLVLLWPILSGDADPGSKANVHTMGWFTILTLPVVTMLVATLTPETMARDAPHEHFALKEYWNMVRRPDMLRLILVDFFAALGPGTTAALYLFFFHDSRGFGAVDISLLLMCYILAGFGAPLIGYAATKFGKHRTLIVCQILYATSQASLFIVPKGVFLANVPGMVGCGFLAGGFTLLVRAMIADIGDDVRLKGGKERVGLLYAIITSVDKVGAAITIAVPLMVLGHFGYKSEAGAVNTPEAIHALEMCYLFTPVIFALAGAFVTFGYDLDAKKHAEIRRQLEERDAMLAEAPIIESITGAGQLPNTPTS